MLCYTKPRSLYQSVLCVSSSVLKLVNPIYHDLKNKGSSCANDRKWKMNLCEKKKLDRSRTYFFLLWPRTDRYHGQKYLGPVHTNPFSNEKGAVLLRFQKDLRPHLSFSYRFRPSTLQRRIRFENAFISSVHMLK